MTVSAVLAGIAAVIGFAAALYSLRASRIGILPGWSVEPGDILLSQMGWVSGTMDAFAKSGDLNKKAAFLTLIAGVSSAASCAVGFCGW